MTMLTEPPDLTFANALFDAIVRTLGLTTPDEASGLWSVLSDVAPDPVEHVTIPPGCTTYCPDGRRPKIVPQLSIGGRKTTFGHYPYTEEGAALAARVHAAAVEAKRAGGTREEIIAAAWRVREATR